MRRIVLVGIVIVTLLLSACQATPEIVKETVTVKETVAVQATPKVKKVVNAVEMLVLPEVNPLEVTGDIVSAGSSTVYPLV